MMKDTNPTTPTPVPENPVPEATHPSVEERLDALEKEVTRLKAREDTVFQMMDFLFSSAGRLDGKAAETEVWLWEIAAALGMDWEYEHGCAFENPRLTSFYERE